MEEGKRRRRGKEAIVKKQLQTREKKSQLVCAKKRKGWLPVFEALEQMKGQVIFVELDAPLERGLVDRHPDRQEEASEDYVVSLLVDLELLFAEEIREDLCRLPKFPVAVEVARSLAEDFLVDFRVAHVFLLDFFLLRDIRQLKLHQIIAFHLLVKRVQNLFVLLNAQKHLLFFFGRVKQLLVRAELRGGCFVCPPWRIRKSRASSVHSQAHRKERKIRANGSKSID